MRTLMEGIVDYCGCTRSLSGVGFYLSDIGITDRKGDKNEN
ncbi:hypothetical protein [Pectinatus frisingensis]